jgi:IS5 family transposase
MRNRLSNRRRSVKLPAVRDRADGARQRPLNRDRLQQRYRRLLDTTSRVVGQAKRFSKGISEDVFLQQNALEGLRVEIDGMVLLVRRVMHQTRARVFQGDTHFEGKIVSVFEPSARSFARAGRRAQRVRQGGGCRKPKIRSSLTVKSALSDSMTPTC